MCEHVDRAASGTAVREALLEARLESLQIAGILRQGIDRTTNVALDGLGCLSEERVGHALAPRDTVALPQLDEDDLLRRVRRAADGERKGEIELGGPNCDLHAGTSSRRALAIVSLSLAFSRTG